MKFSFNLNYTMHLQDRNISLSLCHLCFALSLLLSPFRFFHAHTKPIFSINPICLASNVFLTMN